MNWRNWKSKFVGYILDEAGVEWSFSQNPEACSQSTRIKIVTNHIFKPQPTKNKNERTYTAHHGVQRKNIASGNAFHVIVNLLEQTFIYKK